jgi:glycosyltransferase involved in cell wall biosynthesis
VRILLFSSSYAPRTGGLETVTRRLARELRDRGHPVTVATNRYPRRLSRYEEVDGIPVHRQLYPDILDGFMSGPWSTRIRETLFLLWTPVAFVRLLLLVRRVRPDVVNVHYFSYPAAFMLMAARLLRRPVVLSFHGSDLSSVPYPANYEASLRLACWMADAYTACSRDLAAYLVPVLNASQRRRVVVVHNGTDPSMEATPMLEVPEPFIFVAARLVEKKGVAVAVEAMGKLSRTGKNVHLVIAGDGPQRQQLERLASNLGVRAHITFLGSLPHEEVRALMRRSLFVVVPSYWEAFGMTALEAMADGKAVIASRSGGLPEIVLNECTGLLVDVGHPQAMAEAMDLLLEDPAKAVEMGARGATRAITMFSWADMVDTYEMALELAQRSRACSRVTV